MQLLTPYNTPLLPPDWPYVRSLKSSGAGRSRREEATQERKEPQADQSFSRRNRMGACLFGLCHPPRIKLCSEVCSLRHSRWRLTMQPMTLFTYMICTYSPDDSESYYGYLQCL